MQQWESSWKWNYNCMFSILWNGTTKYVNVWEEQKANLHNPKEKRPLKENWGESHFHFQSFQGCSAKSLRIKLACKGFFLTRLLATKTNGGERERQRNEEESTFQPQVLLSLSLSLSLSLCLSVCPSRSFQVLLTSLFSASASKSEATTFRSTAVKGNRRHKQTQTAVSISAKQLWGLPPSGDESPTFQPTKQRNSHSAFGSGVIA